MSELVELFKRVRVERGVSLRELTGATGVSHSTICSIEHGRRKLTVETAAKLFAAMGLRIELRVVEEADACEPNAIRIRPGRVRRVR